MECHCDRFPGRYISTGAKDTMSATMKPAKEFHEIDVGQPTAACQPMVSLQEKAVYDEEASSDPRWAEHKTPRSVSAAMVHGMVVTDDVFPRQAVESNALLFLSQTSRPRRLVTWSSRCVSFPRTRSVRPAWMSQIAAAPA